MFDTIHNKNLFSLYGISKVKYRTLHKRTRSTTIPNELFFWHSHTHTHVWWRRHLHISPQARLNSHILLVVACQRNVQLRRSIIDFDLTLFLPFSSQQLPSEQRDRWSCVDDIFPVRVRRMTLWRSRGWSEVWRRHSQMERRDHRRTSNRCAIIILAYLYECGKDEWKMIGWSCVHRWRSRERYTNVWCFVGSVLLCVLTGGW